jgi:hypothetical protein
MIFNYIERSVLDDAVDQKNDGAISIVTLDDRLEAFLASSIPNLEFDVELIIDLDDFGSELNP